MEFILEFKSATASQKVGDQIKVTEDAVVIGRDNSCQIQLDESCATVSRQHAKIERDGSQYKVIALSQTNSTFVNGAPVKGERYLNNGDELKFSSQGPTVIFKSTDPRATVAVDATATKATQAAATVRNAAPAAPAKKKSNMPMIIAAVLVVAAIVAGVVFFLNKKKDEKPATTEVVAAPGIETCYNSIYYIKVNDISVYSANKTLVMTFNTDKVISGTGFMLNNGKFVTAKSVIEPWLVVENGVVGSDSDKRVWTYNELIKAGYDVVTNCTAYTAAGTSFKFSNTDCVVSTDGSDWATIAKADQLSTVGGLEMDAEWSVAPKHGTECQIAGYLPNTDIQNLQPSAFKNAVNVTELNKDNMIELTSQRWQEGLSGSPIIIEKDGKLVVIGIATKSNIVDRDVVVPIANAVQ